MATIELILLWWAGSILAIFASASIGYITGRITGKIAEEVSKLWQ